MVKTLRSSRQAGRPGMWHGVVPEALVPSERDRLTGRVGTDRHDSDSKSRRDERDSDHARRPHRDRTHGRPRRPILRRPPVIAAVALVATLALGGTAVAAVRHQRGGDRPDLTTAAAPAGATASPGGVTAAPGPGGPTHTPTAGTADPAAAQLPDRRLYRGTVDSVFHAAQGGKNAKQSFESSVLVMCKDGRACAIAESPVLFPDLPLDLDDGLGTFTQSKHYTQAQICAGKDKFLHGYTAEVTLTETTMVLRYKSKGYSYHCSWGTISASFADATFTGTFSPF